MRLLLFSDLHCDIGASRHLVERSQAVDVAIGAGDFATVRKGLEMTIEVLRAMACPAVVVPGNGESFDELAAACRSWPQAHVLHGSAATVDGVTFYGLGGGVPVTPFGDWSYDFTEDEASELLAGCPEGAVLVSHSPPKGAVDVSSKGDNLGSTAVRATVEAKRPRLVVCGHVHEGWGKTGWVGETPVVNAGPHGVEWPLDF